MLPAHFHDVTYDHNWSKILQELTKSPTQNTRTHCSHTEEQAMSNDELNTSIARV